MAKKKESAEEAVRIPPLFDGVFQRVFGAEESKGITKSLVNAVLTHAGILPYTGPARTWDEEALRELLSAAEPQDLMWVRYEFWENPTGLMDGNGAGPIVIAGHTPTVYLGQMAVQTDRPVLDDDGVCQSVRAGDPDACGGVWDKWNIDSGCAGGAGFGQVTIIRLDDGAEFRERIAEGE